MSEDAVVPELRDLPSVLARLRVELSHPGIGHATIQRVVEAKRW